jgi:diadenosine tetraphosphatase ApaH/serine/threonine PP2A family protein phosphatase
MLLKSHYPNNVYLLRGNHESEKMTTYFTFKSECLIKYNETIYQRFIKSFNTLPLAAIVQNSAFCAHGGISPNIKNIKDINSINRFREITYDGLFCDLMWSDPHENYDMGIGISWQHNERRRCSVKYTYENVKKFLNTNNLKMIIRAHEVQEKGYRLMKHYKGCPSVVTVFSAPSYCDTYQNDGAYIEFDTNIVSIKRFKAVFHPFVINGYFDGINWSLPFISEKIVQFTISLFTELDKEDLIEDAELLATKMAVMRTEREAIDEFEKDESLDCQLLSTMEDDLGFDKAKEMDQKNEMKKEEEPMSEITAEISPSLKNEVLEGLEQKEENDINQIAEDVKVTESREKKEKIEIKKIKKKSKFCRFLCAE